jgi:hypothetical protein
MGRWQALMFDEHDLCRQGTSLIEWSTSISFRLQRFNQLLLWQCRVGRIEFEWEGEGGIWRWKIGWIFINSDLCFNVPFAVCSVPPWLEMPVYLTFSLSVLTWKIIACQQSCAFDVALYSILQPPKSFFVFFWVCAKPIKDLVSSGKLSCQKTSQFLEYVTQWRL